jgi:hypothetical protein
MAAKFDPSLQSKVKSVKEGKIACFIDVYVYKALSEDVFVVGDSSGHVMLDLSDKPEFSKNVAVGKCYRLPKPRFLVDSMIIAQRFGPCPIKPFVVPEVDPATLGTYKIVPPDVTDIKGLDDVCNVNVDTTVSLILKVVFLGMDRKSQYSMFRSAVVKDLYARKHFIQLFGGFKDQVVVGNVYRFCGIVAQQYRKEGEKWGRLRTQAQTQIRSVSSDIEGLFSHVSIGDAFLSGVVIGHEQINYYECCNNCARSKFRSEDSKNKKCKFCGVKVEDAEVGHDFSVNLVLMGESPNDLKTVQAFRSALGFEFNKLNEAQVQAQLERKHMVVCRVEYEKEEAQHKDVVPAKAVLFVEDVEGEEDSCFHE